MVKSILFLVLCLILLLPEVGASALATDGKRIYGEKCEKCHGQGGGGRKGKAPSLAGSEFVRNSDFETIEKVVKNGRMGDEKRYKEIPKNMAPVKLKKKERAAVIAYIKSLAEVPGAEGSVEGPAAEVPLEIPTQRPAPLIQEPTGQYMAPDCDPSEDYDIGDWGVEF